MTHLTLEQILDRESIIRSILRYAAGIDMRDALFRQCFTDELEVNYGSWSGAGPTTMTADDWVAGVQAAIEGFVSTQHTLTNFMVDVQGNEATAVVYLNAQHFLPNDKGDNALTLGGYYTHELVRTAGDWKIRKAQLTVTWTVGNRHIFALARERARGDAQKSQ